MFKKIDHVAIVVESIDEAAKRFADLMDLEMVHDQPVPHLNVRLAYLDAGSGDLLQLVEPTGDGPVAEWLAEHGEGLHHVCFLVDSMTEVLDRLTDEATRPTVVAGGRSMQTCFLPYLPHGLRVELAEA